MKTYTFLTLAFIVLITSMAVTALMIERYLMPQIANVSAVAMYLDDVQWTNNTVVDWGDVEPDNTYLWSFRVNNTYTAPVNVTLYVSGLPVDWTETWSMNKTIIPVGANVVADLTLYVPAGATGSASWDMWINVVEA